MKFTKKSLLIAAACLAVGTGAFVTHSAINADVVDAAGEDLRSVQFYIPDDIGFRNEDSDDGSELTFYQYNEDREGDVGAAWPGTAEGLTFDSETNVATIEGIQPEATHIILVNNGAGRQTENIWLQAVCGNYQAVFGDATVEGGSATMALRAPGSDGKWQYYLHVSNDSGHVYNSTYFRTWLDRSDVAYGYYFYSYELDGLTHLVAPTGYQNSQQGINEQGAWYCYFDVPMEAYGHDYSYVWCEDKMGSFFETPVHEWEEFDNSKLHEIVPDWDKSSESWTLKGIGLQAKTLAANEISAEFFGQHVLSGYFSCLDSAANGYPAAPTLYENWLNQGDTWFIQGMLSDVKITDYATGNEAGYATGDIGTGQEVSAQQKIDQMLAMEKNANPDAAGASFYSFSDPKDVGLMAFAGLALVAAIGFGAYFYLRKRKAR